MMADYRVHCVTVIGAADDDNEDPAIRGIRLGPGPASVGHRTRRARARREGGPRAPSTTTTPLVILSGLDIAAVLAHGNS